MNYDNDTSILSIANDFYNAYERCVEGKNEVKIGNMIKSDIVNIPAIVNGAFAIELYLKSILPPTTKGHKMAYLFNSLDEVDRMNIKLLVEPKLEKLTFNEALDILNNSFIKWRYIHESNDISKFIDTIKILPIFLKTIKEYVTNKQ